MKYPDNGPGRRRGEVGGRSRGRNDDHNRVDSVDERRGWNERFFF